MAAKNQKRKVKIIQLRIVCKDEHGNKMTRLIDEKKLNELQAEFTTAGGDFFKLLIEQSYESKIILVN